MTDHEEIPDEPRERYVIRLAVTASELPSADLLARTLTRALRLPPELLCGTTTITLVQDQPAHHRPDETAQGSSLT